MKTAKILNTGMSLILVIGLTVSTFGSSDPTSTTVSTIEENTAGTMQLNVPSDMETFVSVLDQDGKMIYSDMVMKGEKAGKMYDFSGVENGVYVFKTVTDHKSVETTFSVEMNELRVLKEEISYRPVFWIQGDILSISYMNLNQDNIYLTLDDASYLYYEEVTDNDMSYGRMLNIKNLSEGEYSVTLKSGENTYNYFFDK